MKRLTEREEELMNMLWDNGPMHVREMVERFDQPRPHFNTISTFVRILEQKGFVGHLADGKSYRYYALTSREEYSRSSLRDVITRYFDNSYKRMISALVDDENLSDDDLSELIDLVNRGRKSGSDSSSPDPKP